MYLNINEIMYIKEDRKEFKTVYEWSKILTVTLVLDLVFSGFTPNKLLLALNNGTCVIILCLILVNIHVV